MNRRPLRKKLGSRTSRRANTKRGKKRVARPRTKLAKLIETAAKPLRSAPGGVVGPGYSGP